MAKSTVWNGKACKQGCSKVFECVIINDTCVERTRLYTTKEISARPGIRKRNLRYIFNR